MSNSTNNFFRHLDILTTGTTTVSDQSTANTDIIFAGTSSSNEPTLQFIGSVDVTNTYSLRSVTVAGNPWTEGTPSYGTIALGFRANLDITSGVRVIDGQLNIQSFYGTNVAFGGNSLIDDNGTLNSSGARQQSPATTLDGTMLLGANGANQASFAGEGLVGNGTLRQIGKDDLTFVDYVGPGVHLDIRSGTLAAGGAVGGIDGTIGPVNGRGPSLGPTATFEFFGYGFSSTDTKTATFDSSTGLLSLIDSRGQDVGDFHFSGNARGLNVSVVPDSGFNAGYVAITDHPRSASAIPITFT